MLLSIQDLHVATYIHIDLYTYLQSKVSEVQIAQLIMMKRGTYVCGQVQWLALSYMIALS